MIPDHIISEADKYQGRTDLPGELFTLGKESAHRKLSSGGRNAPLRCLCGNLLARLTLGGVELKCRRCKRLMIIPLEHDPETERNTARTLLPRLL